MLNKDSFSKAVCIKFKRSFTNVLAFFLLSMAIATNPVNVLAVDTATQCNGVNTFFNWECTGTDGESIILGLLSTFLNWMAVGVSVAVLIGLVVGAVMYASSGGNEAQAKKAMEYIRNAITALILYFIMYAALQYLIPGGIF